MVVPGHRLLVPQALAGSAIRAATVTTSQVQVVVGAVRVAMAEALAVPPLVVPEALVLHHPSLEHPSLAQAAAVEADTTGPQEVPLLAVAERVPRVVVLDRQQPRTLEAVAVVLALHPAVERFSAATAAPAS